MKLEGKVAMISGGAGGLGRAIADAMAKEGARLSVCDIDEASMARLTAQIRAEGREIIGLTCDVASSGEVRAWFDATLARFGTVDILVNNAGKIPNIPADSARRDMFYRYLAAAAPGQALHFTSQIGDDEWLGFFGTNVHGVFFCTREALKVMEPNRYGRIINIASTAGISPFSAFAPHYSATKGAVVAFTKAVAMEVAGANILVNAIAPGLTETGALLKSYAQIGTSSQAGLMQLIPMRRLGRTSELASLAVFLASEEHYLVGQIISPNGGLVI